MANKYYTNIVADPIDKMMSCPGCECSTCALDIPFNERKKPECFASIFNDMIYKINKGGNKS